MLQAFVADRLGIDPEDVLVHTTLSGGGFGRRAFADFAAQAAAIAQRIKRPVKMIWSRHSDMSQGFYRPSAMIAMSGGIDSTQKLVGLKAHCISQAITGSSANSLAALMPGVPAALQHVVVNSILGMFASSSIVDLFACEGMKDLPYQIDNVRVDFSPVRTKIPVATWRAVGHSLNGFALESFVDELAHAAKVDPLVFRTNMLPAGSKQRRVLDALAEFSKWGSPAAAGTGRGLARHHSFETEVGQVVDVEIVDGKIRVRRVYCVVDCGIAVNPDVVRSNMEGAILFGLGAALEQEITMKDGVVQQQNFDTFPSMRMVDSPQISVKILPSDKPPTGAGEPGLPPIAAAVANAVFALTRVRLRKQPLQTAWLQRGVK
jgi:isoquinoline 1-oxidoreductase subunit beta